MDGDGPAFERFVIDVEPRLRRALVATYGAQVGREATVDALAYAWEHRARLSVMTNPAGYLYRVGQTSARRQRTVEANALDVATRAAMVGPSDDPPAFEPALGPALAALSEQQRAGVVLVHGYGWSLREAAGVLGVSVSTLRNHLERAMTRLRKALEVDHVR
jgi:RNA polymerase sigma factor (sigma-70 family)